jgi:hypothetical protein
MTLLDDFREFLLCLNARSVEFLVGMLALPGFSTAFQSISHLAIISSRTSLPSAAPKTWPTSRASAEGGRVLDPASAG